MDYEKRKAQLEAEKQKLLQQGSQAQQQLQAGQQALVAIAQNIAKIDGQLAMLEEMQPDVPSVA